MKLRPLYRFDFGIHPPVIRVRPGAVLDFTLPDSDGLGPDMKRQPRGLFDWKRDEPFPGNPVHGPIHITGAEVGDAVEVRFLDIRPNRRIARTWIAPNHGFLPGHLLRDLRESKSVARVPKRMIHWKLGRDTARIANPFGRRVPPIKLVPFLGCVATAQRTHIRSLDAGSHGGNIDLADLTAGSTLWLPVSVPGGLLYLGDMHAAQGHGETVGGALEVSGTVRVRCSVKKSARLRWPRYQTAQGRGCIVVQKRMEDGVKIALAEAIQWLTEDGLNRYDAYMLASQTCEFKLGGVNDRWSVVASFLPISTFASRARRA